MAENSLPDCAGVHAGSYENWHQWHRVQHGDGCLDALSAELDRLHIKRPFLVSQGSLLARVRGSAGRAIAGEFSEASAHSPREDVLKAAALARAAAPDGFIAFGGSTVVDTTKAVALALAADLRTRESFDGYVSIGGRENELDGRLLPQVALPTTLSGAEYGRDIGITNAQLRKKELYRYDAVVPRSIMLDPQLAAATPARLWSSTGIKVMSDAIEQVYSRRSHAVLDALCLQAIRWFALYLPLSFGPDPALSADARMHCQLASWMALFGTHNAGTGVALGGALRHQLGGMLRIAHGEASCVMLPHLLLFNLDAVPDGYLRLAEALGVTAPGQTLQQRGHALAGRIRALVSELGLPNRLGPLGVTEGDLAHLATHALEEPAAGFNPRPVRDAQELVGLLRAAL